MARPVEKDRTARLSCRINPEIKELAKDMAVQSGITLSDLIEELIVANSGGIASRKRQEELENEIDEATT